MPAHPTVGVHDDLAAGQPGVAHRSANDEAPGWIDVVLGISVQQRCRNHHLDDLSEYLGPQRVSGNLFRMLRGDNNRVHPHRLAIAVVLYRDLAFAVRA